jgi:DNA-3-methyladenine glycosylase
VEVAPRLLGGVLEVTVGEARVAVRLTEVEAYHGAGTGPEPDPGSHARMGRTARNATMWGEPGHLYVYLSHGIHSCVNVVCAPEGQAGGILRARAVIEGEDVAFARRPPRGSRGSGSRPGRLGDAVGLRHPVHDGIDAVTARPRAGASPDCGCRWCPRRRRGGSPRRVAGVAGRPRSVAVLDLGDPTVSPFRWGRGAGPTL